MHNFSFKRAASALVAAVLAVSALPMAAFAAKGSDEFTLMEIKGTDVTLEQTVFPYTGEPIQPKVTVQVEDRKLTVGKDYTLEYRDNVEVGTGMVIVNGIATAAPSYGYTGTVEIPFTIEAPKPEFTLIELKDTDVTIDSTTFDYTGNPIEPAVTVTVGGQALVSGKDYAVEYVNNLLPGTGTVIVRGIATASETVGYTGEVRIDFTIRMTEESYPLVELKQEHVTINGKEFTHTGKEITPEITVTVEGKTLTAGKDYNLRYEDNIQPGTGKAIVTGIATATELGGYTGEVVVKFTIKEAASSAPEGEQKPEEEQKPSYKITLGDGSTWYQGSQQGLSFTVSGDYADFTGVSVNGKALKQDSYSAKSGTVVLLKNAYLKTLAIGKQEITFHFEDGSVSGTFHIAGAQENPKTGDTIGIWVAVMAVSAVLGGAMLTFGKKAYK